MTIAFVNLRVVRAKRTRDGWAVEFMHGLDSDGGKPRIIPPMRHPSQRGQEVAYKPNNFRTRKAAEEFMGAVALVDILPRDRAATKEEVIALRDWLIEEGRVA